MKFVVIGILLCLLCVPAYASAAWSDYLSVEYLDMDGDFANEIIIKTRYGAGSGHYCEEMRIFKDDGLELKLIFAGLMIDSYFGYDEHNSEDVTSIEFSEPTFENGIRDIITKTETRYYKDNDHKVFDRKENLGTKVFKWDGAKYTETNASLEK